MNSLDKVLEYRRRVEQSRKQAAKAEGALEQSIKDLSHGYGCGTIKNARLALRELQRRRDRAKLEATEKLKAFEEKWKEQLE